MWSFNQAALTLILMSLVATPAQAAHFSDCAPDPSSPTAPVVIPGGASPRAIWSWGSQLVLELPGGLLLNGNSLPFASPEESVVTTLPTADGRYLTLTTSARGFSAYVGAPSSSTWTHLYSTALDEGFQAPLVVKSPLVDVAFNGDAVFLLSNFHVRKVSAADLLAGRYTPIDTPLTSFSSTQGPSSGYRAEAFVRAPWLSGLDVVESAYSAGYAFEAGYTGDVGIGWDFVAELEEVGDTYFNVLRNHAVMDTHSHSWAAVVIETASVGPYYPYPIGPSLQTPGLSWQAVYGEISSAATQLVNDFPLAAGFDQPDDPVNGLGALSFSNLGTFLFQNGKPVCRISPTPLSSLVFSSTAGARIQISGVTWNGVFQAGGYFSGSALVPN